MRTCLFVIPLLVLPGYSLTAENAFDGALFVCDSFDDRVLRLADLDGSGGFESDVAGEVLVFYDGSGGGPELSVPSHLALDGDGNLYLLDGGTLDAILVLKDENGDGDANDGGEVKVFYDNTAEGPRFATPNTLLLLADGSFLVSDDGSRARRILHLKDLNGDGDALDAGEATVLYDSSSQAEILLEDPESIALLPDGSLLVGDSTHEAVYRLTDVDGNGDFLGAGEVNLFFQSNDSLGLTDVDALAVADDGIVYAVNEDTGLVIRLLDLDGNGDANGTGEAIPFLDGTAAASVRDVNDMLLLPGGDMILLDGAADSVFLAADLDADGAALGEGEVIRLLLDGGVSFATPSGVAFRPGTVVLPPVDEFLRGDANSDTNVDISDAVTVLDYLFLGGVRDGCLDAMDADDTGLVNISDPIYLLNFLFLGGSAPPPPFPRSGVDPTGDDLSCR